MYTIKCYKRINIIFVQYKLFRKFDFFFPTALDYNKIQSRNKPLPGEHITGSMSFAFISQR